MYLIDWAQANLLMFLTVLVLVGIPVVIGIMAFGKKSGQNLPDSDAEQKEL